MNGFNRDYIIDKFNYKDAMAEFRLMFDGRDPWGSTMIWWFAVADAIYWRFGWEYVPVSWLFSPSANNESSNDPDAIETEVVNEMELEDLLLFGKVLDRYASLLKWKGHLY